MASGRGGRRRWVWITLAVLLLLLIAGRLAMPSIIKRIVEAKLYTMPGGFQGSLEDVEVRALDGEIGLVNFRIRKKNGAIPVPFLHVKEFVLKTEREGWRPRTVMRYVEPTFNFVDAESDAKKQKGPTHSIETLRQKLPFELLRVEVQDGTIHFRNYQTKPDLDLYAQHVNAVWDHLVGCLPPGSSACRSTIEGSLQLLQSGSLKVSGRFARTPENDFHIQGTLRNLRAAELGPFLAEYAKVKTKGGVIGLDLRYDRHGDRHDALLLPLLSDVEFEQAESKAKSFFIQLGAGAVAGWFERKDGQKGIRIRKGPKGDAEFELVDRPKPRAEDAAKRSD